MTPERERSTAVTNPIKTRRAYFTFSVLTWAFAILVDVGVDLLMHASLGTFAFAVCFLTLTVVFWLWVFRRFTR
jgi:hypothetical protein